MLSFYFIFRETLEDQSSKFFFMAKFSDSLLHSIDTQFWFQLYHDTSGLIPVDFMNVMLILAEDQSWALCGSTWFMPQKNLIRFGY